MKITLPPLYPAQLAIARDPTRFRIVVVGRRGGKTLMASVVAVAEALEGRPVVWIAPTYSQSGVGFDACKRLCASIPGVQVRESIRTITLHTGGTIEFRSADQPDNLRGHSWALAVIDEAAMVDVETFDSVIRPALADRRGRMIAISTPRMVGDAFHGWFLRGQTGTDPEWKSWQLPSSANPFLPPGEIEAARESMSSIAFQREFLAEFVTSAGARVQRAWLRIETPPACRSIAQGIDLAISEKSTADYTACVTVGRARDGIVWVLDAERGRFPFAGLLAFVIRKAGEWKPYRIAVEQVSAFAGVVTELQRKTRLPVRGVRPVGGKLERFAPLEGRIESGQIRFASTLPAWFLDELCSFPASKNDDGVDALVHAWAIDSGSGNGAERLRAAMRDPQAAAATMRRLQGA